MPPAPLRRRALLAGVTSAGLTLAGCSGGSPSTSAGSAGSGSSKETPMGFDNPVYGFDFPDPQVLRDGDGWMAIATNGNGMNVQVITSADLVDWQQGDDALPEVAAWSAPGKVWAPEIIAWPTGGYRLYYTTRGPDPEVQCVSVASSDTLAGPYRDSSSKPLVYEKAEGGSIDASPFVDDDGTTWLYWKNDGNAVGRDSWIKVQRLSDDGLTLVGKPVRLFHQDLPWEGPLVEGPAMVRIDGTYHLFYSGNGFWSDQYGVGHASATKPTGPFTKDPEPLLTSNDVAAGPGHNQLFTVGSQWWTVYHAWLPGEVGQSVSGRQMFLSRVHFDGKKATIDPPAAHVAHKPGEDG